MKLTAMLNKGDRCEPGFMIALLITGALMIPAGAQESGSAQDMNSVMAGFPRQESSSIAIRPTQRQVPPASRDAEGYPQHSDDYGQRFIAGIQTVATSASHSYSHTPVA